MDIRLKNSQEAELLRTVLIISLEYIDYKPAKDVCTNVIKQIDELLDKGL